MQKTPLKTTIIIALIAIALIIPLNLIGFYNSLVRKNQAVDTQWSQVETQYQRRFDLIPNLVRSVEGIMKQEKDVFIAIADARSRYEGASSADQKAEAASGVESALSRLLVIMENYPQLNSQQNVTQLMDELAGTENRIAVERRRYNEAVSDYNLSVKTFPGNLVAPTFGFNQRNFFTAAEAASQAPQVEINN